MKQINRIECDSLGEVELPSTAYYGIATERAWQNFAITGVTIDFTFIKALVMIKKAAALANHQVGVLTTEKCKLIVQACDEVLANQFQDQFITDSIQGGAGTSFNMNVNEVLANRANEIAGFALGSYALIHPNDDVNQSQSTNDAVPSAAKLALLMKSEALLQELNALADTLTLQAIAFDDVIKLGRTHLQDAVPMRLGQVFSAFASVVRREAKYIEVALSDFHVLNMGATAVGTGINSSQKYIDAVTKNISELSGISFVQAENLVDATRHADYYMRLSSALKCCAVSISKICNDIRLMASGPHGGFSELILPAVQPGSSIMPGKVNPVIPEVVNQVCFAMIGNDITVSKAVEAGQLELNVFAPIVIKTLLDSIVTMTRAVETLHTKAIVEIEPNRDSCSCTTEKSAGVATALIPYIGYDKASHIAKESLRRKLSIRTIMMESGLLEPQQIDLILDVYQMTEIR